jgi:hypothetical protein
VHTDEQHSRVSVRDLADPTHARRSLRASIERRRARRRRERLGAGGRRALLGASCLLALGSAGAAAHSTGGSGARDARAAASSARDARAGFDVRAVQAALGVTVDGIVGPQTRRAIKRFQRRNGLTPDGIVGPKTLAALGLDGGDAAAGAGETAGTAGDAPVDARLERIAQCESGGDPTAVSPDGRYRGKYQFSRATWRDLGGRGDPAQAPEAEQDRRAAMLLERQGPSAWPVCASS